jgi:hypothetical protein
MPVIVGVVDFEDLGRVDDAAPDVPGASVTDAAIPEGRE